MKTKRFPIFTTALNSARNAINAAQGMFQEIALPAGETTIRYRLSPYGEFPVDDVNGKPIIQVVDREAAETMAINFGSLRTKFATFFKGIPMYEGHPDDPEWRKNNPGHRMIALARLKSIEPADDGIYTTAVLNAKGIEKLDGEAPEYSGHSPNWRLSEIPGRPGHFRPILLWSDGLTNMPNIMTNTIALNSLQGVGDEDLSTDAGGSGETEIATETENQENDMKLTPAALQALGFAPEADPSAEEISAAILKMLGDKATAEADKATAVGETAAVNTRLSLMETELNLVRGTAVETVIGEAIQTGRITEADKPAWTTALNTSFASEAAKLKTLMPVLITENRLGDQARRDLSVTDASNAVSRITEGVTAYAVEKKIDITTAAGWTKAYDACRIAKPELFAKG